MTQGCEFLLPKSQPNGFFTVADFSDEQLLIQQTIRDFVNQEILPHSERIENKDLEFTRELLVKLGELGMLGLEIPEADGGSGLDKVTAAIVAEQLAWQGSFACTMLDQTGIGLLPIIYFGSEELRAKYLPKLLSAEWVGAYALTEVGAGSDAAGIRTQAIPSLDGEFYVLNGEKTFVTNGGIADVVTVFAQVTGVGVTAFVIETAWSGVAVGREEHKIGIVGSSTTTLQLNDVRVPVSNVLGGLEANQGLKIALNILNIGRFKLGAACLGGARQCLAEALEYASQRKQFGLPIRDFGLIRQKLVRMAAEIFAMEAIVYRTAELLDEVTVSVDKTDSHAVLRAIREVSAECSIVKVFCSEAGGRISDDNVQVHGGNGFTKDYAAARHWLDARINRIFEGTNEINRLWLFKMVSDKMDKGSLASALIAESKRIREKVMSMIVPDESETVVDRLLYQLNCAKEITLLVCGTAVEKLAKQLGDPNFQEVVGLISDVLIDLFVLDSVLGVFAKHSNEKHELLSRLVFAATLPRIEQNAKNLLACCSEGDELRILLSAVRKLLKYEPENILELDRKILAML